jgi:RNA polymerase sigma-70 factor (ECF subfamily)
MSVDTALTAALHPAQAPVDAITAQDFGNLVLRHQRRVYRVIFLLTRDEDAADTLTQECFLRAYQKRESFRGECAMETWLLRIAVNLARDHGKNRRATFWRRLAPLEESFREGRAKLQPAGPEPSPERVLLAREELDAVWVAVAALSEQQRQIFLLRFAEEMPLAEVAGVLGLKLGTVKAQLFRATSRIREKLREGPCE